MYSIEEIKKANDNYKKEYAKLNLLSDEVRKINDNIDLEEVKEKLNYAESKELYILILSRSNDKERCKEFKKILEEKKAIEYPKINDVHYYPIIDDIDFLSKEDKINLSKLIKEVYRNRNKINEIKKLNKMTIDFLIKNSLLEKNYVFHCSCGGFECYDEVITQEKFDKLKDYWEKDKKGLTTDEEDEEMHYGCFEVGCWNDGMLEICSLEDFNEHLKRIEYKVKVKPDTTLDDI